MPAPTDPAAPSTTVLFDLDGTITDSFTGIAESLRHALRVTGNPDPDPQEIAGIAGPPMLETLQRLCGDDARARQAMAAYRARYTSVGWAQNAVFPQMRELLADLRSTGRTMAVATSKNQETAVRILSHFGLADLFDVVAGASADGSRANKDAVVEHALVSLGRTPRLVTDGGTDGVVIVGDRAHDILGAACFGIPTVFVGWGYALDGEADAARWRVRSVDELRKVLGV